LVQYQEIKTTKLAPKTDDFAIDPETLAQFIQIAQSGLPSSVKIAALPFEDLEMFSFDDASEVKTDNVLRVLNAIFTQSGIDKNIFSTDRPSVASMNLSKLLDAEFVSRLYSQFEDFCTYHVNKLTKKYKFKIVFEGTIFDRDERKKHALEMAQNGIITPKIAAAEGMNIKDFMNSIAFMKWLGFADKLTPIKTSYTLSKQDSKGGRPSKTSNELTDAGEITRNAGSNEDKITEEYE